MNKLVLPVAIMLPDAQTGSDPVIALYDYVSKLLRQVVVQLRENVPSAPTDEQPEPKITKSIQPRKSGGKRKRVRSWEPTIVKTLRGGPLSKDDLAKAIGAKPSNLASTLSRLAKRKAIVTRKRDGRVVYGLPAER